MKRLLILFALLACNPASAQWQTPNNSVPIGRRAGVTGFKSVAPGVINNCLVSNGTIWTAAPCSSGGVASFNTRIGAVVPTTNDYNFNQLAGTATLSQVGGLGTGIATALAVNVGTAGAPVVNGGALGTPSSGTLTNVSGLPIAGVTGWGTGVATALGVNIGTAGAPALFSGALGVATATSINIGGGSAGLGNLTVNGAGFLGILSGFQTDGASSTTGGGGFDAKSDTTEILYLANGSARTTVRYGLTIGGYGEFSVFDNGTGSNGLIFGVQPAKPIIFGTNNVVRMRLMGTSNHLAPEGTAPALTSCGGGSPAISGTDRAGEVTMGTSATGCIITFNVAYAAAPYCTVTWPAQTLASQSYTYATTAITLTQTSTSSNKIIYHCTARSGG